MANNFKERLSTYVNCLQKMLDAEFEYSAIQRELYKFIQFGIDDDYSVEALILANAYKLDQINGLGLDVPLEHLEETLIIDEEPRPLPENMLKVMTPHDLEQYKDMQEKQRTDEDLLRLFNISLGAYQFKPNPYYQMFKTYDSEIDGE